MNKETVKVYKYAARCIECKEGFDVYYTFADFGDAPVLLRCRHCNEYYWYTPDDDAYIRPIDAQLKGITCAGCGAGLKDCLVPTHKDIECCGYRFSLDDNFADNISLRDDEMTTLQVNMIYSV